MSKYAMLNCWDDKNKGDLGIMLSTVEEFRRQDPTCEIIAVSSFNEADPLFISSHRILKEYVSNVYPGIFGTLGLKIGKSYKKDTLSKIIAFLAESVRYYACLWSPISIARIFLTKAERETLDALRECNAVFSKGGSVFTDYGNKRGAIALRRLCRMYSLLNKFGVKYYVLGQSFGPVSSKSAIKDTNSVIRNAECVYLRELECRKEYPDLELNNSNVEFSNDAGFLIKQIEVSPNPVDTSKMNVGITFHCDDNDSSYIEEMSEFIDYLITSCGATIHVFRQVSMDNEPDDKIAEKIIANVSEKTRIHIQYHRESYLPQELSWLYGKMDYFVGTRLHSTIFAMCAGTPTMVIAYHGTKAQGIFHNLGIPDLVITGELSQNELRSKFEYLVQRKDQIYETISNGVGIARREMQDAIASIIRDA